MEQPKMEKKKRKSPAGKNAVVRKIALVLGILFLTGGTLFADFVNFPETSGAALTTDGLLNQFDLFTSEMGSALSTNNSIGLNWSSPYIGQFLGIPLHFGAGLTLGTAMFTFDETDDFVRMWGMDISKPIIGRQQILPMYTVELKFGGFANLPFDFGIKIGWLPDLPLWGPMTYAVSNFGFDLGVTVFRSETSGTAVAVGGGYTHLDAKISGKVVDPLSASFAKDTQGYGFSGWQANDGASVFFEDADNPNTKVTLGVESDIISLKLIGNQPVIDTGVTIFAAVQAGLLLTKGIFKLTPKDPYGSLAGVSGATRDTIETVLPWLVDFPTGELKYTWEGDGSKLKVENFTVTTNNTNVSFNAVAGLGIELGYIHIDVAVLINVMSSVVGFSLGVRYQQ
jgi:hypothetical protein